MADEAAVHQQPGRANWPLVVTAGLLCFATAAFYLPSLDNGFLALDDYQLIVENRVIRPLTTELKRAWRGPVFEIYMPLTYTLWAVESEWFSRPDPSSELRSLAPGPFHAVCVLLHAMNVSLVFVLLKRLGGEMIAAAAGALLFAVHPLQVESVYWITETKGTLCGFFGLMALAAYVRFAAGNDRERLARMAYYLVASGCFMLALLAKPSAAVVPLLAILLDVGWLRRSWRQALAALLPWLAISAVFAWVAKGAQGDELLEFVPQTMHRPLVALDALAFYTRKVFWPLELVIDYGRAPQAVLKDIGPTLAWSVASIVILVVLAIGWRRRRPWAVAGWIFVVALLPVLGFVSFAFQTYSTVADRYAYLAMLGPALALAWWLERGGRGTAVVAGLALALLAAANFSQGRYWQNSRTLFERTLAVNPQSWLAQLKLAMLDGDEADAALVERRFEDARRLRDVELARYQATLTIKPDLAGARANLGFLLLRLDRARDAAREFEILLAQRPDEPRGHTGLGIALFQLGRTEAAAAQFREVVRLRPKRRTAHLQLGMALLKLGHYPEAQTAFERVLADRADVAEARWRLAQALQFQGRAAEAVREYRYVLAINRPPPTVAADLAWLLATHEDKTIRQSEEALKLAKQACTDAEALDDAVRQDILATALAASGSFSAAASMANKAAAIAARDGNRQLADEIRAREALYQEGEPFVQPLPLPRAAAEIEFDLGRRE